MDWRSRSVHLHWLTFCMGGTSFLKQTPLKLQANPMIISMNSSSCCVIWELVVSPLGLGYSIKARPFSSFRRSKEPLLMLYCPLLYINKIKGFGGSRSCGKLCMWYFLYEVILFIYLALHRSIIWLRGIFVAHRIGIWGFQFAYLLPC